MEKLATRNWTAAIWPRCAVILIIAMFAVSAQADVSLPTFISSNMVLQRSMKVPIWGKAAPGERVTVELDGQQASATANANGNWRVLIGPYSAGGPFTMTVSGHNTVKVQNVLVGEVWVCAGQSNMAMAMDPDLPIGAEGILNASQIMAAAHFPDIRLFQMERVTTGTPQQSTSGEWAETTPHSVATFSAVGYLFARELYERLHVPIAMIESAWGGTPAQAWTSRDALLASPELKGLVEASDNKIAGYDAALNDFQTRLRAWQPLADAAEQKGGRVPAPPQMPADPRSDAAARVSGLYNGMIAPLVPFAIRGVIWYQGESNTTAPEQYRTLFPVLIHDWRKAWDEGDFPFIYVQLPNFDPHIWRSWGFWKPSAPPSRWPELREAQLMTLSLPQTAMAVTIDVGDPVRIHPRNKQPVAHRLVLAALHLAYGYAGPYSGPIYQRMTIERSKIRLSFDHVDGGLKAKGGALTGFEIAGSDGRYVPANAEIVGQHVVVSSPEVPHPMQARYGWANNPDCNLYNAAGLPASPFRTDSIH